MIVLDANVLIAHLDGDDLQHDRAEALLLSVTGETFAASPITLAEVLVGPARHGQLDHASAALKQLQIASVALIEDAPLQLALLRAETQLKLPDCCVLLAADQARAAVATFDSRLATVARDRGITVRDE